MQNVATVLALAAIAAAQAGSRCPSAHPFAYRPNNGFDYCCASGDPDSRDGGGAKQHCKNDQYVQCSSPPCVDRAAVAEFNILDAQGPHRYKVSEDGEGEGWSLIESFYAYTSQVEGTVQFNILDAQGPHRYKVTEDGEGEGWSLQDSFWAYTSNPGNGAVQFNILDAQGPHRYKVSEDGEGEGWSLQDSFWAYTSDPGNGAVADHKVTATIGGAGENGGDVAIDKK
jgi:hypothetical protein